MADVAALGAPLAFLSAAEFWRTLAPGPAPSDAALWTPQSVPGRSHVQFPRRLAPLRTSDVEVFRRARGCCAAAAILLAGPWATPAAAQDQLILQFYHGKNRESGPATYEMNDGVRPTLKRRINQPMAEGSEVCVRIVNPHPVLYGYSLAVAVDTTPPPAPEGISAFLSPLNTVFGAQGSALAGTAELTGATFIPADAGVGSSDARIAVAGLRADEDTYFDQIEELREQLDDLAADIKAAQEAARASDQPEVLVHGAGGIATSAPPADGKGGLAYAQQAMRALPGEPGRFNDDKLAETLKNAQASLDAALKDAPEGYKRFAQLLYERGATLMQVRNALRATYIGATLPGPICETVKRGRNTVTLRVVRRDTLLTPARDTGAALLTATVATYYPRPLLELIPVAYGIYSPRVAEFEVRDSVVRRDEADAYRFRGGTMLVINPLMFGPDRSIALGGGLGLGFGGGDEAVSDFIVGALLSYRNYFRVGIGGGWAELPRRLKAPAQEGAPLPANAGKLDDLVETRRKGALFAIFQLAGLSVPIIK